MSLTFEGAKVIGPTASDADLVAALKVLRGDTRVDESARKRIEKGWKDTITVAGLVESGWAVLTPAARTAVRDAVRILQEGIRLVPMTHNQIYTAFGAIHYQADRVLVELPDGTRKPILRTTIPAQCSQDNPIILHVS